MGILITSLGTSQRARADLSRGLSIEKEEEEEEEEEEKSIREYCKSKIIHKIIHFYKC